MSAPPAPDPPKGSSPTGSPTGSPAPPQNPGEGLRSLRTSTLFRITNFELYARPNKVIMALGLLGLTISIGYMAYMRTYYEKMGLYVAVDEEGNQILRQRKSRWE